MKILIVDDFSTMRRIIKNLLRDLGFTNTAEADDGTTALPMLHSGNFDFLVTDWNMPGMTGIDLLRAVRADERLKHLPVLMVTARGELSDRVRGLDQGADYYLTKPFQTPELLACVRLLLRRSNGESGGDDRIHRGDLVLDPGTFQVTCGQRSARLSRKEYDLLEMLMRNGGQILSKEQLLLKAWGYESNAEDNNVEVYISFLRRKLELVRSNMRIRTVRLVGYCLEEKE